MNKQGDAVEWRSVIGYEGLYEVSSDGQVRRLGGTPKCNKTRLLKPAKSKSNGYWSVVLSKAGEVRQIEIHRLVMWVFVGAQGLNWVNHINGNKDDNRRENLEYVSASENIKHAYRMGLMPPRTGSANPHAKVTESMVREILTSHKLGISRKELSQRFGLSKTAIQNIVTGATWRHVHE